MVACSDGYCAVQAATGAEAAAKRKQAAAEKSCGYDGLPTWPRPRFQGEVHHHAVFGAIRQRQ